MSFRDIRRKIYIAAPFIGIPLIAGLVLYRQCNPGEATETIGIKAVDGFEEETEAAMDIWNGFVGCEFLVAGDDVLVKSDDGAPCGDLWRPEDEWGHAAAAYRCPDGKSEILISQPGTVWMQTWTIGHEIGHTLSEHGVAHNAIGIMGKTPRDDGGSPPMIRIRDRDVDALKKAFCK